MSASNQKLEMLTCGSRLGKSCTFWSQKKSRWKCSMSRRTAQKKDKKEMSNFEKFVTEFNEKADELAKVGATLDEGLMAEIRAKTFQQERERGACSLAVLLRLKQKENWIFVDQKREEMKHQSEWCAQANRYRCVMWRRSSKCMKMPGKCTGSKYLSGKFGKWRKRHLGGHDLERE